MADDTDTQGQPAPDQGAAPPAWEDVADTFNAAFPGTDPEENRKLYGQALKLRQARQDAANTTETVPQKLARQALPFASAGIGVGDEVSYARSKARYDAGQAEDGDLHAIADHEQRQVNDQRSMGTWAGALTRAGYGAAAMGGEAAVGGKALTAAAGAVPGAGFLAPEASELAAQPLARRAAGGLARAAAQTAVMPSTYAEQGVQRNVAAGRAAYDPRGIGTAFGLATAQTAVLGQIGRYTDKLLPGEGAAAAFGRTALAGGSFPVYQAAQDVVTSAVGLDTGYGTVGDILRGDPQGALRNATVQALTAAAFHAAHGGGQEGAERVTQEFARQLQAQAKGGAPADAAGRAMLFPHQLVGGILQHNPDPNRITVEQAVGQMDPGPSRDWGATLASLFPETAPGHKPAGGVQPVEGEFGPQGDAALRRARQPAPPQQEPPPAAPPGAPAEAPASSPPAPQGPEPAPPPPEAPPGMDLETMRSALKALGLDSRKMAPEKVRSEAKRLGIDQGEVRQPQAVQPQKAATYGVPPEAAPEAAPGLKQVLAGWDDPAAQALLRHPQLDEIAKHVPPGSKPLGAGGSSVALRTPEGDVVRVGLNVPRPDIPEVLQPKSRQVVRRTTAVERLPYVDTKGITGADVQEMAGRLKARGYELVDPQPENLGRTGDGRLVVLDAGAVAKAEGGELTLHHGTQSAFDRFDPAKAHEETGVGGKGFFFSEDPEAAKFHEGWGGTGTSPRTVSVNVPRGRIIDVNEARARFGEGDISGRLRKAGYAGVYKPATREHVLFNPNEFLPPKKGPPDAGPSTPAQPVGPAAPEPKQGALERQVLGALRGDAESGTPAEVWRTLNASRKAKGLARLPLADVKAALDTLEGAGHVERHQFEDADPIYVPRETIGVTPADVEAGKSQLYGAQQALLAAHKKAQKEFHESLQRDVAAALARRGPEQQASVRRDVERDLQKGNAALQAQPADEGNRPPAAAHPGAPAADAVSAPAGGQLAPTERARRARVEARHPDIFQSAAEAGVSKSSLHEMAPDIMKKDREEVALHNGFIDKAVQLYDHYTGRDKESMDARAKGKGVPDLMQGLVKKGKTEDEASVPAWDVISRSLHGAYPGVFSDENYGQEALDKLNQGRRKPVSEEKAYDQAFQILAEVENHERVKSEARRKGQPAPRVAEGVRFGEEAGEDEGRAEAVAPGPPGDHEDAGSGQEPEAGGDVSFAFGASEPAGGHGPGGGAGDDAGAGRPGAVHPGGHGLEPGLADALSYAEEAERINRVMGGPSGADLPADEQTFPSLRGVGDKDRVAEAQARYDHRDRTAKGGGLFGGDDLQGRAGLSKLPDGAPVLFVEGEFKGKVGKVVLDRGEMRAEVPGHDGLVPVDHTSVEPLNPWQSWRTTATTAPQQQGGLFNAQSFLGLAKGLLEDEGGHLDLGHPAVQQFAGELKRRYDGLVDFIGKLGGKKAPKTARLDRDSADTIARFDGAHDRAAFMAPLMTDKVLGRDSTPEFDRLFGGVISERRLRWMRTAFDQAAAGASGRAADLRKRAQADADQGFAKHPREVWQAMIEAEAKQATRWMRQSRDVTSTIGWDNSPFKTFDDYKAALKSPQVQEALKQWDALMVPEMEENFRTAQGLDDDDPIHDMTQVPGSPMNLKGVAPGEEDTETTARRPGTRGNLRAPRLGRFVFARQARGNADAYDLSAAAIIRNSLDRGYKAAAKAEMYRTMEAGGVAQWGKPGQKVPGFTEFKDVNPPPGTQEAKAGETAFYVRDEAQGEFRQVLGTDKPFAQMPGSGFFNAASLASAVEPMTHLKNQIGMLIARPGMSPRNFVTNALDVLAKDEGFVGRVAQLAGGDYARGQGRLADLARIGAVTAPQEGYQGKVLPEWAKAGNVPLDLTHYLSKVVEVTGQAMRLTADDAFDRMKKLGLAAPDEGNRRDFINQLGNYSKRTQSQIVAVLRDTGVGPFATAGAANNVQAMRSLLVDPGMRATDPAAALQLRARMLGRTLAVASVVPLLNYLAWGRADGDDKTPLLSVKLGTDATGRTHYLPVANWLGLDRGAKAVGALAFAEGARTGRPVGHSADKALEDFAETWMHPAMGPLPTATYTTITGKNAIGIPVARQAKGKDSQAWENLKAALGNANPVIAAGTGRGRPESQQKRPPTWADVAEGLTGPFVRARKTPPGKDIPSHGLRRR